MRELERDLSSLPPVPRQLAVIGRGRLGRAMSRSLSAAGISVTGPLGREWSGEELPAVVLLCVPDGALEKLAAALPSDRLVGHCSGASALDVLTPHEAFSLHPLMSVPEDGASFTGAGAAVAGSTPRALTLARALAERLGMLPFELAPEDRAAYHAAASIASNFLVTLEGAAERMAGEAGVGRTLLLPLVRATVENWGARGAREALTGPVARGDEVTVAAQRTAVAERAPELLTLFDTMVAETRRLAAAASRSKALEATKPAASPAPAAA